MECNRIYRTELYKMCKRKLNFILFIPSLLALVITVAYSTGNLYISQVGQTDQIIFSCIDFLSFIWMFISGTGIYAVLIILVTSFQFCSEIEQGQIKLMLLRVGKRIHIIIGKLLALLTFIVSSIILFISTTIMSYYVFLAPSEMGNGEFETTSLSTNGLLFSIGATILSFIILILITYLVGIKFTPFMSFILSFIIMLIVKSMIQMPALSLMKYTTFSMESQLMNYLAIENITLVRFGVMTSLTIALLFISISYYFNKVDIK